MELAEICSSSRVIIVAGKGGVGKTTVSAALAVAAARAGRTALLVELEGKSGLPALFGVDSLEGGPNGIGAAVYPGVTAINLFPDEALLEYLSNHGLGRISKRLVSTGAIDVVSTAVPGMKDILVLGKVKALQRAEVADVIIVDGPAAGHAVTFLLSPKGLLDAVRVGPVLTQAIEVAEMLADPERALVMLVTLPEETPVSETLETAAVLTGRVGLTLAPLIVNGVYGERPFEAGADVTSVAADAGVTLTDTELAGLAGAAEFICTRSDLQRQQLDRLDDQLSLPRTHLPFLFTAELGATELETLADALTAQLVMDMPAPVPPYPAPPDPVYTDPETE